MDIQFTCDACGQLITASEEMCGHAVNCPNPACGCHLHVPSEPPNEADDITFECLFCRHLLVVDKKGAGLKVACPECGEKIVVPSQAAALEPTHATIPLTTESELNSSVKAQSHKQEVSNYFYADERNQPVGPYDAAKMRQLFQQGILSKGTWVILEGEKQWQPFSSLFLPSKVSTVVKTVVKERHGCLTSWLSLMLIANALLVGGIICALFDGGSGNSTEEWTIRGLVVFGGLNITFTLALFRWKKWGLFGGIVASLIVIAVGIFINEAKIMVDVVIGLLELIGLAILCGILRLEKNAITGWSNLGFKEIERVRRKSTPYVNFNSDNVLPVAGSTSSVPGVIFEVVRRNGEIAECISSARLRECILQKRLGRTTKVRTVVLGAEGNREESPWTTLEMLQTSHPPIRDLYFPVWHSTMKFIDYGVKIGIAIKALDSWSVFGEASTNMGGAWFLVMISLAFAKKWPIAPLVGVLCASRASSMENYFDALMLFSSALAGTVIVGWIFGALGGMVLGTLIGYCKAPFVKKAPDAIPEGFGPFGRGLVLPGLALAALVPFYIWLVKKCASF